MRRPYLVPLTVLIVFFSLFEAGTALAVSHGDATVRGCRTGGFHNRNVLDPEWVSVMPDDAAQVAEGVVRESHVATNDWPPTHDSHDWNFVVALDPAYQFLHSDANPTAVGGEQRMEMEWEEKYFPVGFRPADNDRFWMLGRWIFDCGHPPDYRTEIHPPKAVAFTRSAPTILPGDTHASPTNKTFVYIHGRGGYYNTPVAQQDYDFDIPMPTKPPPLSNSARLGGPCINIFCATAPVPRALVRSSSGGVTPVLTLVPARDPTHIHVHYPLAAIADASPDREFAATIITGWHQDIPTIKYRQFCVSLDSIKILHDHDTFGSGEWNLRLYDGAEWFLPAASVRHQLNDVTDGQVVALRDSHDHRTCTAIVNVSGSGSIRIEAGGWESDGIDDLFGIGGTILNPFKLLDTNDNIGFVNHAFGASALFGTGGHDTLSRATDDDEQFGSDPAPGKGGGDYRLRYRITEQGVPGKAKATVPDVFQMAQAEAASVVRAAGLVPRFSGPTRTSSFVATQSPTAGRVVDRGSTVTMVLRSGPKR